MSSDRRDIFLAGVVEYLETVKRLCVRRELMARYEHAQAVIYSDGTGFLSFAGKNFGGPKEPITAAFDEALYWIIQGGDKEFCNLAIGLTAEGRYPEASDA